ncbi:MAG: acyltransferase [Alphaproteobacteria bacterium]|nr:acyltransferase [Alphaproteobacteria bacterium]QQS57698.1 MAG: acyltransferase [Alphaproteobacteria bacterium]
MRNGWLDYLKVVLAVMVIGLHSLVFLESFPALSSFLCNGVFRAAVPLFFVISGYFLPRETDSRKLYNWLKRILVLYAVWTLVYLPVFIWQIPLTAVGVFRLLKVILFGYGHLWYLPALAVAAFITIKTKKLGSRFNLLLALGLYCTGCTLLFYLLSSSPGIPPFYYYRNAVLFGLPFVLAGYYYNDLEHFFEKSRPVVLLLAFALFLVEISIVKYFALGRSVDMYFSLIILCPAVFGWVKSHRPFESSLPLGKLSLALYLVHPFFVIYGKYWGVPEGSALFFFSLISSTFAAIALVLFSRRFRFIL